MKKTYHGGCHCGAVRFECELDLAEGTSKCNCSIRTKTRFWKSTVKAEAFQLLHGEDALSDYQFGGDAIHHLFCRRTSIDHAGSLTSLPIEPAINGEAGDGDLRPRSTELVQQTVLPGRPSAHRLEGLVEAAD